jgi:hypothetical protein
MPFSCRTALPRSSSRSRASPGPPRVRRRQPIWRALLPGFFILGFLLPAAAAEVEIDAKVGFHGVYQLGRPFPIEVTLVNSGRTVDGLLEIQVWKGGVQAGVPYPALHRREVFLPARSRRTVQFTIDPDFLSRPLKIQFTGASVSASRELDLRRHFSPGPIILSLSESGAASVASLGASVTNRVVSLKPAELPADGRALLGVSHLVLYDQSLRELSRGQLAALDDWLASGGKMLIIGSLNFALYQEPQLGRYLPVRVSGVRRITFAPAVDGGNAITIPEVWVQTGAVIKGNVTLRSHGLPVLVEHDWGKGKVTYLALDAGRPPLSRWAGLATYLQQLLGPAAGESAAIRSQWSDAIFSQLLLSPSFISAYIPTASLFLAIVGYLTGVFGLSLLWQRRHISRRTLTPSCCGWILLCGATGFVFFSRGGQVPDGVLLSATVMESAGDGYVEAQTNLALFSTQLRDYTLAFGPGWMDLTPLPVPAYAQPSQTLVYRHGGGTTRLQLPLKEWGFRLLRSRYLMRFPLSATIEPQDSRLLLKVQNRSGKDLTDCWLVAPGTRVALGDLPKGESWTKTFPLGAAPAHRDQSSVRNPDEISLREVTFNDKTRDVLFHTSFFARDGADAAWRSGAALFFGWIKDPERRIEIDDPRIRAHNYALFRLIVPIGGAEDE